MSPRRLLISKLANLITSVCQDTTDDKMNLESDL